ncbi:MAG: hypothetical protein ACRDY0_02220 [Acidimicrobiales bacterium]
MSDDPFSGTGAAYLHHLLLAALTGPRGAGALAPGRLVARILMALDGAGGDRVVARYCAPVPGAGSRFTLRPGASTSSDGRPAVMGASEALHGACRLAATQPVAMVGETSGGLVRRVFEGGPDRPLRYLWPDAAEYEGDDDACIDALEQWAWVMDRWRSDPPGAATLPGRETGRAALAATRPGPASTPRPGPALTPAPAGEAGGTPPVPPEPSPPASPEPSVALVATTPAMARSDPDPSSVPTAATPAVPVEVLAGAVRQALGDVTVDVDLGAVERLVAGALQTAMRAALASRSTPGEAALDQASVERIVAALAPMLAAPAGAAAVSGNPGGRDSELAARAAGGVGDHGVGDHRAGDDLLARATLVAASEELFLQLESMTDRIRAGTRALESLADELAARDRTASRYLDRVAQRTDTAVDRLGQRLGDRIEELTKSSAARSVDHHQMRELASEVSELVRALGQGQGEAGAREAGAGPGRQSDHLAG